MDALRDYLISITAAALISGIAIGITNKSGSISSIVKLLAGLFMTITVLYPLVDIRLSEAQLYWEQLSLDGDYTAAIGKTAAESEIKQIIMDRSCAYILEKASELGADIQVEVFLQDLRPDAVKIFGAVSPYTKQQLSKYITSNLGISLEDQHWIG